MFVSSTKRRAQSFIISYIDTTLSLRTIKCCPVIFGVTLRLLGINISSSSPAINKLRRLLPAASVTTCGTVVRRRRVDNTCSRSQTGQHAVEQILTQNRDFCLSHPHSTALMGGGPRWNVAMTFGKEKLEWCGNPMVTKNDDTMIRYSF